MDYNRYTEFEGDILDQETGLVWKAQPESGLFTFEEALNLESTEWKLPTIKELLTVIDYDLANPSTKLPNQTLGIYWSSSPNALYSDVAWVVGFGYGSAGNSSRNIGRCIRLIRR